MVRDEWGWGVYGMRNEESFLFFGHGGMVLG